MVQSTLDVIKASRDWRRTYVTVPRQAMSHTPRSNDKPYVFGHPMITPPRPFPHPPPFACCVTRQVPLKKSASERSQLAAALRLLSDHFRSNGSFMRKKRQNKKQTCKQTGTMCILVTPREAHPCVGPCRLAYRPSYYEAAVMRVPR